MTQAAAVTLYLDTASDRLMAGLSVDGVMTGRYEAHCDSHRYHSALMTPAIEALLKDSGLTPRDLSGIAVNKGPGSFTGVRTGMITARTLAQFLPLDAYAFSTFDLLALPDREAGQGSRPLAIYLDARRGKAFYAEVDYERGIPVYRREPSLAILAENPLEEGVDVLASESLREAFPTEAMHIRYFSQIPYTPERMCRLIQQDPKRFRVPWKELLPLYLQEPSITLRKAPPL